MVKLSIAVGGAYEPNNTQYYYSPFDSMDSAFTQEEEERKTLPGLVMLPEEPKVLYRNLSSSCISLDALDWLPNDELMPIYLK